MAEVMQRTGLEAVLAVLKQRSLEITLVAAAAGLALGLVYPGVFRVLKATLPAAIFLMIFQPMFALSLQAVRRGGLRARVKFLGLVTLLYTLVFPAMTAAFFLLAVHLFPGEEARLILAGAVLVALAPVAMPAPALASIAGGDVELALLSVVWTFMLSFLVLPAYAYLILHAVVHVPVGLIVRALILYILTPFIVGQVLRRLVLRRGRGAYVRVNTVLLIVSLLALFYLIFVVFGASAHIIAGNPAAIAAITGALFAYFGSRFLIAYLAGRAAHFDYPRLVSLVYAATGNGAIGVAISLSAFGPVATTGAVLAGPLVLVVLMTVVLKICLRCRRGQG